MTLVFLQYLEHRQTSTEGINLFSTFISNIYLCHPVRNCQDLIVYCQKSYTGPNAIWMTLAADNQKTMQQTMLFY